MLKEGGGQPDDDVLTLAPTLQEELGSSGGGSIVKAAKGTGVGRGGFGICGCSAANRVVICEMEAVIVANSD